LDGKKKSHDGRGVSCGDLQRGKFTGRWLDTKRKKKKKKGEEGSQGSPSLDRKEERLLANGKKKTRAPLIKRGGRGTRRGATLIFGKPVGHAKKVEVRQEEAVKTGRWPGEGGEPAR